VHGLLGYSFLKRFRVACDIPVACCARPDSSYHDAHPYEQHHVGLQLERIGGRLESSRWSRDPRRRRLGSPPVTS